MEWWNDGKMGPGLRLIEPIPRRGKWRNALLIEYPMTRNKKKDIIPLKNQQPIIPLFHYFYPVKLFFYFTGAMVEAKTKASVIVYIFSAAAGYNLHDD
jgi:hypothetical protein